MSGWRCPKNLCDGSGFLYDEETNTARDCPCRPQLIAQARTTRLKGRLPRRYAEVAFEQPPVTDMPPVVVRKVRRWVENLDENLSAGLGLWFEGPQGTGKTTLAMLASKFAIDAGRSVAIYSAPRLLAEIRDTFDEGSAFGTSELIERLSEIDLLQLDDLGAERSSPWVLEQLYAVINGRYEAERAVLVTTNLDRDALIEQVGARTVSRLTEMCDVIPLYGDDHRISAQESPSLRAPAVPSAPPAYWDKRDPWPPAASVSDPAPPRRGLGT